MYCFERSCMYFPVNGRLSQFLCTIFLISLFY